LGLRSSFTRRPSPLAPTSGALERQLCLDLSRQKVDWLHPRVRNVGGSHPRLMLVGTPPPISNEPISAEVVLPV
jgi:hypothetical protein